MSGILCYISISIINNYINANRLNEHCFIEQI